MYIYPLENTKTIFNKSAPLHPQKKKRNNMTVPKQVL